MSFSEKDDLEASQPQPSHTAARGALGPDTSISSRKRHLSNFAAAMRQRLCIKVDASIVSDAILGLSDGMTVPFALAAGLTAFGTTRIVIVGGLAELVAGAISMGLGGYLGARSVS